MDKKNKISFADGILRGVIFYISVETICTKMVVDNIEMFIACIILGIIISCGSLCYAVYVNKGSLFKNFLISVIGYVITTGICFCVSSKVMKLQEYVIGPGEGMILLLYFAIWLIAMMSCRGISAIIVWANRIRSI